VESLVHRPTSLVYRTAQGTTGEADLLVLADGGGATQLLPGASVREDDYGQMAIIGALRADRPHAATAWERFTPDGPAALLPQADPHGYNFVWTLPAAAAAARMDQDDTGFVRDFQAHFGQRAGRFSQPGARKCFPLKLRTVNSRKSGAVVVIGNAAQTLHPVAGQGLNLGLRDAAELARQLRGGASALAVVQAFHRARDRDRARTVAFTDFLVRRFSSDQGALRVLRGAGLVALDLLPPARRRLGEAMMFGAR
jgi:2-octaprenyl-6-methoxyphenol hydroxylase